MLTFEQGYDTVAGLGKTGYNVASGLGGAVTGGGKQAETEAAEGAEEAEEAAKAKE
jgi:hypothetical protein